MAQNFQQLERQIKDLNDKVQRLGGVGFTDVDAAILAMNNDLIQANKAVKDLLDEVNDLEDIFENISETLRNVIKDLNNQTKAVTLINRGYSKLEGIATKLANHRKDEEIQSVRQLKNLAKKAKLEYDSLVSARDLALINSTDSTLTAKEQAKALYYYKEVNAALLDKKSYLRDLLNYSLYEVEREKELQKTLGLTGQLFKGIEGSLKHIGIESEAISEISKKMREAAKSGSQLKVAGTAIKGTFKAALESLKDPVVYVGLLVKGFKELYHIGAEFSKETYEIAKNQLVTSEQAHLSAEEMKHLALNSKEALGYQKNFVEATNALNDSFGTSADFTGKTLEDFTNLTKKLGLTNDEAASFARFSQITGKTQEEIVNSIGKQNKGVISNRRVLTEVAKVNGQLYAQYKGSPDLIGKAVIQTQKLGITLQQAQGIAKGLLNFESSISAELEAELLTGKQLNLEQARYLALQGDSAGAAQEVLRQVGSLAEFQRLNVIQQEALAKAAGMETDELANSLIKQEQLKHILGDQTSIYQKQVKELRDKGKVEQADELEKQILQGKTLEVAKLNLDAQTRISAAGEKMKDSLNSIIAGPLGTMVEMVASLFEKFATSSFGKYALAAFGVAGAIAVGVGAIIALGNTIRSLFLGKRGDSIQRPLYTFDTATGAITGTPGESQFAGGSFSAGKQLLKGRKLGKFGKFAKGGAGAIAGMGVDALSGYAEESGNKGLATGLNIGGSALTGASIGSLIAPGIGTAVGAALGAVYGIYESTQPKGPELATGGIVMKKTTRATVGEAGPEAIIPLNAFYAKLDDLITATREGGNVIMSSTAIGHVGAMNTFSI
jgi:hypothetical protein